ncbi:MAG: phage portal protein [Lachnospiraceae bacterium]|nr:phage portal protein [Lachnospiraceae bacterium]
MESYIKNMLHKKGYTVNEDALDVIRECGDWYGNRRIDGFHNRVTVQGAPYELNRLNFAKRCCSDDANLCEVLEINAGNSHKESDETKQEGPDEQSKFINAILQASEFNTQYRKQLEKTSAEGTTACYIRLDNATILTNGKATKGDIRLNYVEADSFIPLTVENDIVTEAAFAGSAMKQGKKETTLVLFTKKENQYTAETHVFDEHGTEKKDLETIVHLGDVKPFAVMRNAEVNNLDNMTGYGLPKIHNAIPMLKALDLCYNVLYGDLDKADKLLIVNDLMCKFDDNGEPITPNEQAKKLFVLIGQDKLPDAKELVTEYNPEIRIEGITKAFELNLSLLSMMFGYGTKKYSFENGQITTATEFVLSRQDQMQELNRQRQEATRYIQDICHAVMWFSNTFHGTSFNVDEEIKVEFDDSLITDKEAELERVRNDALNFDIPELLQWYLESAYNLKPKEAENLVSKRNEEEEQDSDEEED